MQDTQTRSDIVWTRSITEPSHRAVYTRYTYIGVRNGRHVATLYKTGLQSFYYWSYPGEARGRLIMPPTTTLSKAKQYVAELKLDSTREKVVEHV